MPETALREMDRINRDLGVLKIMEDYLAKYPEQEWLWQDAQDDNLVQDADGYHVDLVAAVEQFAREAITRGFML